MILKTGVFALSILDQSAPFSLFQQFGFQCGRTIDKLANTPVQRTPEGVAYLMQHSSAWIAGKVVQTMDLGTHTLFLADVTDAGVLSGAEPVTYAYYQKAIKPKPQPTNKKGWRCKVCGYIYEGDPLPADFICPICKHGAADFERIG